MVSCISHLFSLSVIYKNLKYIPCVRSFYTCLSAINRNVTSLKYDNENSCCVKLVIGFMYSVMVKL